MENKGLIEDPRSIEEKSQDYVMGAETAIKYEDRVTDWSEFVPEGEPQSSNTFDTTLTADKITVTSSSRFTVKEAGVYQLSFSAEITAGVANKTGDIWVRVNGTDVANSNRKRTIINNETAVLTIAGITISMTAGQYIEFWFNGDDTSIALPASAAGVTPTRPVTPSILFTLTRIHP